MNDIARFMKSLRSCLIVLAALEVRPDKPHDNDDDGRDNDVLNCTHVFGDAFPVVSQHGACANEKNVPQQTANECANNVWEQFHLAETCRD